jgi:hypothetical protein
MIEGCRGVREGAIFAPHMTYEKNIIPYDDIKKRFRIID